MTPEERRLRVEAVVTDLRRLHRDYFSEADGGDYCQEDDADWPCDMSLLADALDNAEARATNAEAERDAAMAQVAALVLKIDYIRWKAEQHAAKYWGADIIMMIAERALAAFRAGRLLPVETAMEQIMLNRWRDEREVLDAIKAMAELQDESGPLSYERRFHAQMQVNKAVCRWLGDDKRLAYWEKREREFRAPPTEPERIVSRWRAMEAVVQAARGYLDGDVKGAVVRRRALRAALDAPALTEGR